MKRLVGFGRDRAVVGCGGGRPQDEWERLKVVVRPGECDCARDHVAELAHVARPVIALEAFERGAPDLLRELSRAGSLEEHRDEPREIFATLAQRGYVNLDDREPIVEVAAEPATRDLAVDIAVCRRDDPHVELLALAPAEGYDLAGLEHT